MGIHLHRRRRRHATLILASAAFVLASLAPAAVAGPTPEQLGRAKERLAELEASVRGAQRTVSRLQDRITVIGKQVGRRQAAFERARLRLIRARARVAQVQAELEVIEARLADRALSTLWMGSPTSMEFLLESDSWVGALDRMEFLNTLQIADGNLAAQIRVKAAELETRRAEEELAVDEDARRLARLDARQEELLRTLARQQDALEGIVDARREALQLVRQLRIKLASSFGGETLPFGTWAELFLTKLGAPVCQQNLIAVVAWQVAEYTTARWNPLATTLLMPGSWTYNSHSVQNYVSLAQGLEASKLTLDRGYYRFGYGPIVQSLRNCADASVTAQAINASLWCRGCAGGAYVTGLIPAVRAYFERYANLSR